MSAPKKLIQSCLTVHVTKVHVVLQSKFQNSLLKSWRKVQRLSVCVQEEDHKKGANPVTVQIHITSTYMEKKGMALDLKTMRFIHSKEWKALLCEGIVTEHMKPNIVKA